MLFLRIVTNRVDQLIKLRTQLLNHTCDRLLLRLKVLILSKVLCILRLEALEDFTFVGLTRVHLHELLYGVEVIMERDSVRHDLLFLLTDFLQSSELLLNAHDSRIASHVLGTSSLRNHARQVLARLRK